MATAGKSSPKATSSMDWVSDAINLNMIFPQLIGKILRDARHSMLAGCVGKARPIGLVQDFVRTPAHSGGNLLSRCI